MDLTTTSTLLQELVWDLLLRPSWLSLVSSLILLNEVCIHSISGYKTREEAIINIVQTLNNNLLTKWPRETFSGFMVHFSNRNLDALSEFSTIDSTIAVLGSLFAGNYFGGEVKHLLI